MIIAVNDCNIKKKVFIDGKMINNSGGYLKNDARTTWVSNIDPQDPFSCILVIP